MTDDKKTNDTENKNADGYLISDKREARRIRRELRRLRKELRYQRSSKDQSLRYIFWGLMLVLWGILIFLLQQNRISTDEMWKAFITGLGTIFVIQAIICYINRSSRAVGRLIPGVILLYIGLGFLFGLNNWWSPLTLIIAGAAVFFVSWFLRKEIEQRKITQETLHESEVKYRHIIDNANSIIMELDTSGNISFINKFGLHFFGFRESEIIGHNPTDTIRASISPDGDNRKNIIEDITAFPEKYLHYEDENIRKNGDKVWIIWTYKPIFDEESNNLKEILCIGIDNTQRKKAEQVAVQQLKEKTAIDERTRLARDLHDAVSQTLFSTSLIAEVLPKVWERNKEEGLKKLEEVRHQTRGALAEMRTLLFELRPAALADADLNDLLRQLAESVIGKSHIQVDVDTDCGYELPTDVKVTVYRITQESLNNIVKHSGASRAQVSLTGQTDCICLRITDNGNGFDMDRIATGSFGLNNIKERADNIGADLHVESKINHGTEITLNWQDRSRRELK